MRPGICSSFFTLTFLCFLSATLKQASAQSSAAVETAFRAIAPHDRVVLPVEDSDRVALDGNTLPQALAAFETGPVEPGHRFNRMLLLLKPDATQQSALEALVAGQQNPRSPLYHQWLTPESYAGHFGASSGDIEQVEDWLQRYGLEIDEVTANHRTLVFSGTAAQVEAAFRTPMKHYRIAGQDHLANASDPLIPSALAAVVEGVASLHDFFSVPQHAAKKLSPEFSASGAHYLSPSDFATIYDVSSLYRQAYDGSGESIAILGRSDIAMADVRKFRSQFGLAANDPVVVTNGSDPGTSVSGDLDEAMLDVEWSGAVAPKATIEFVTSASTAVSDGIFLSAQYAINHNVAPILSVSYGLCEASLGSSGNQFFRSLWQQAAAQGITVLVSAGDSGAAGCDAASATRATQGRGVNGICSTPYSTCVGGTQLSDTASPGLYWSSTNSSSGGSALGYIPEAVWNESGAGGLWSTGGGGKHPLSETSLAERAWSAGRWTA